MLCNKRNDDNNDGKKNSRDAKKQNLEFTSPKIVVGMYEYMANCRPTHESPAAQFYSFTAVFPCADVEHGLDNFYDLESIGIKDEGSLYELEWV